ncbi:GntR family transcriptional regulator [Paenibacillus allorhizosphaerae]|uniref:HTH-type transcriptional repressor NagR n=1 Tax=Paenibacillus allorhizosphaerae TaxID=2849866 RepID=A0ABM8VAL8_9BACL|nr:GntR family transcriptional regulator [Paenibacillus allorhizosphaerae]CAG7616850.1 HTH-type transcriptional repressor NagR [Paenibacillus allorhizosphaerae]
MNKHNKKLDSKSPLPLHYQLQEIIRFEALNGDLADKNGKMPTEIELMARFEVSRITVRQALSKLVDQGLLHRERGKGTFLKTNHAEHWTGQLLGFSETITASGFTPGGKTLKYGVAKTLADEIKSKLMVQTAWELKRLRYADDLPIAIEHSYFPEAIGMRLEQQELGSVLTYAYMEKELGVTLRNGTQNISAKNAGKQEAKMLGIVEGTALLSITRIIYAADQTPVEYLEAVYRPDYFQYTVQLQR